MIQLRKLVSGALSLSTALTLSGFGLAASAYAAPLTETQIALTDSRGTVSSTYTFSFKAASTTDVKGFKFTFSNRASGSVTVPDNWSGGGAALASVKLNGGAPIAGFVIDVTDAANGNIVVKTAGAGVTPVANGDTIEVVLNTITNPSAVVVGGNECDSPSIANTDTCYTRIGTYDNGTYASIIAGTGVIDTSVATYTVVTPVTVTATVDPSLTFTVLGVSSGNIAGNDGQASCANVVTSTATTLPFGNLGVGITNNKCTQQSLAVATNANFGYDTYLKFRGAAANANTMMGTISGNNIDPYTGTFGSPTAFSADPTGNTANVNTGWIGVRTTNIGGFNGANLYAGPTVNSDGSTAGDKVMTKSSPDIGTSPTYVTYKIAVNALQPADTYTGTAVYNVIAKY